MQEPTQEEWENLWSQAHGSVHQSWQYNEARKNAGDKPRIISIASGEKGKLAGGIMAYEKIIRSPLGKKNILEVHGSPLFINKTAGAQLLKQFRRETISYFYATISPAVLHPIESLFVQEGYTKVSNHTILLNLKKSEDELWQALEKKSIRWGVKTAQKNNLSFAPLKDKREISELYAMYKHTASVGRFNPESREFVEALVSTGISQLFGMHLEKKLVAGALVFFDAHNKIATLSLTAASEEGLRLQAMPFLYWNIMLHAKKNGFSYFDLGGYDSDARSSEKMHNINKFKERFGGEIIEQPVFSTNRVYPFLRSLLQKARFFRHLYKKN